MVPFFCYCLRKHKRIILFFKFPIKPHLQKPQNISCIGNIANLSKTLDLTQFFFSKLNVVKTNTTKIRIIELKHEKKKSFMNICYIVCYVRNKHRQKSVKKKEPSIQTLIDTYIRKLTKSLKYKITWSQTSGLFYHFLTSMGFRCLNPFRCKVVKVLYKRQLGIFGLL